MKPLPGAHPPPASCPRVGPANNPVVGGTTAQPHCKDLQWNHTHDAMNRHYSWVRGLPQDDCGRHDGWRAAVAVAAMSLIKHESSSLHRSLHNHLLSTPVAGSPRCSCRQQLPLRAALGPARNATATDHSSTPPRTQEQRGGGMWSGGGFDLSAGLSSLQAVGDRFSRVSGPAGARHPEGAPRGPPPSLPPLLPAPPPAAARRLSHCLLRPPASPAAQG